MRIGLRPMARRTITPADAESCELHQADSQKDCEQPQTAMRFAWSSLSFLDAMQS
jgi:hypothetical protein